ncbi:MAG TPA: hypothetical protein PKE13_17850 [Hyphomicrobium zavarzinii]|nr:hypothetical protein [Hyphomicrobium zavarzinii]
MKPISNAVPASMLTPRKGVQFAIIRSQLRIKLSLPWLIARASASGESEAASAMALSRGKTPVNPNFAQSRFFSAPWASASGKKTSGPAR